MGSIQVTLKLGNRRGSVGRLMPGQAARILNPDTLEDWPIDSVGVLRSSGTERFCGLPGGGGAYG